MRLPWLRVAIFVLFASAALLARQGVVQTKDGNSFEGDVVQRDGTVDITPRGQLTTTVKQANVAAILYPDEVAAEVKKQEAKLAPDDVVGRLALAQHAVDADALEAARDLLLDAVKIDSRNADARAMLDKVERRLHVEAAANPTTAPTTRTAVAPNPAAPAHDAGPGGQSSDASARRMVTPDEINDIRRLELTSTDPSVRVKIDGDTKRRFLSNGSISPGEFNSMSPAMQAFTILTSNKGNFELAKGVHILSDPMSLAVFKKEINKTLVAGCAVTGCHTGKPVGGFVLFPQVDNDAAVYSNFVILQRHNVQMKDREHLMIDRQNPSDSLLLQFVLPQELADFPHPGHNPYRGAVRNRTDTRFRQIEGWISHTPFPGPDYSKLDLSKPPTTRPAE